jgi:branched-chain amino acid aminotransferase
MDAKKEGFMDNLFLELETYTPTALDNAVLQEMSAANVFFVLSTGEIVTPSLDRGTILPGVTRDSVITLIQDFAGDLKEAMKESTGQDKVTVSSRDVTVGELRNATEGTLIIWLQNLVSGTK